MHWHHLLLDRVSRAGLYTHYQYIAGFFVVGGFAHGAIYLLRNDCAWQSATVATFLTQHRASIISHLSYVSGFLGFHTLGLYVHNDFMAGYGVPENMLLMHLPALSRFRFYHVINDELQGLGG